MLTFQVPLVCFHEHKDLCAPYKVLVLGLATLYGVVKVNTESLQLGWELEASLES